MQETQKFKVTFDSIVGWRLAWATWAPALKKKVGVNRNTKISQRKETRNVVLQVVHKQCYLSSLTSLGHNLRTTYKSLHRLGHKGAKQLFWTNHGKRTVFCGRVQPGPELLKTVSSWGPQLSTYVKLSSNATVSKYSCRCYSCLIRLTTNQQPSDFKKLAGAPNSL